MGKTYRYNGNLTRSPAHRKVDRYTGYVGEDAYHPDKKRQYKRHVNKVNRQVLNKETKDYE